MIILKLTAVSDRINCIILPSIIKVPQHVNILKGWKSFECGSFMHQQCLFKLYNSTVITTIHLIRIWSILNEAQSKVSLTADQTLCKEHLKHSWHIEAEESSYSLHGVSNLACKMVREFFITQVTSIKRIFPDQTPIQLCSRPVHLYILWCYIIPTNQLGQHRVIERRERELLLKNATILSIFYKCCKESPVRLFDLMLSTAIIQLKRIHLQ